MSHVLMNNVQHQHFAVRTVGVPTRETFCSCFISSNLPPPSSPPSSSSVMLLRCETCLQWTFDYVLSANAAAEDHRRRWWTSAKMQLLPCVCVLRIRATGHSINEIIQKDYNLLWLRWHTSVSTNPQNHTTNRYLWLQRLQHAMIVSLWTHSVL